MSTIIRYFIATPLGKLNEPTEPPAADWAIAELHSSIHSYYYYNAWFPPLPLYRWIDDVANAVVFLITGGSSTTKRRSLFIHNIFQQSGLFIIYFYFMSVTV